MWHVFPGYNAKVILYLSGSGKTVTVPAHSYRWSYSIQDVEIYSTAGGLYPDTLPANSLPILFFLRGNIRDDFDPFSNPIAVPGSTVSLYIYLQKERIPSTIGNALITHLETEARTDGTVDYLMVFKAMWQNTSILFGGNNGQNIFGGNT